MNNPDLIVGSPGTTEPGLGSAASISMWRVLRVTGALLLTAGVADILLAVVPANLGDSAQRFGTFVGVASGWPILAIGLVGLLAGSFGLRSELGVRVAAALHGLAVLVLALMLVSMLADRGDVAAKAGIASVSINRGFIRAAVSCSIFGVMHGSLLLTGLRLLRTRDR